jgi:hypothetical protein
MDSGVILFEIKLLLKGTRIFSTIGHNNGGIFHSSMTPTSGINFIVTALNLCQSLKLFVYPAFTRLHYGREAEHKQEKRINQRRK